MPRMSPSIGKVPPVPLGNLPKPAGFADRLDDARAIADYIDSLTPDGVDLEFVEELFRDGTAQLIFCPLDSLTPGHPDQNIPIPSRERKYARLPLATCPPLVIQDGEIQDGHHRYRVALSAGAPGLWCYDVIFPDE
jgi:hypothetical protein